MIRWSYTCSTITVITVQYTVYKIYKYKFRTKKCQFMTSFSITSPTIGNGKATVADAAVATWSLFLAPIKQGCTLVRFGSGRVGSGRFGLVWVGLDTAAFAQPETRLNWWAEAGGLWSPPTEESDRSPLESERSEGRIGLTKGDLIGRRLSHSLSRSR